jgi:hypothetical protein
MPAAIIASSTCGSFEAGPIVATMLVERIPKRTYLPPHARPAP